MSELLERTLGHVRNWLELEARKLKTRQLRAVTLCLLLYPSDEAHQIIKAILNG